MDPHTLVTETDDQRPLERTGRRGSEMGNLIFAIVVFVVLVGGFLFLALISR
jgi:hypothetical protein